MNFFELIKKFPTEEKAINHFMNTRYEVVICLHCESTKVYRRKDNVKFFACKECNNSFSIFKGTIFEKSTTDIRKWFYAISTFINVKKGISACQLQRDTGVTYKTAWRMLNQIRLAMSNMEIEKFMNVVVEIDETYVGGKPRNRNKDNKRGRETNKNSVVSIVNRDNKQVYCKIVLPNKQCKKLSGKQLLSILEETCKGENIVVTDEFRSYNILESKDNFYTLL